MKKYFLLKKGNVAALFIGVMLTTIIIKKIAYDYMSSSYQQDIVVTPGIDREAEAGDSDSYKNAIVTEIVPVFKLNKKRAADGKDIKKQPGPKNSQYKVGLFSSINGLQLTVFNGSPNFIDKVLVTVDFLKPDGQVVQSENVLFSSIKSKDAETISIPGTNYGLKVRYRILKVYSHDYEVIQRIA